MKHNDAFYIADTEFRVQLKTDRDNVQLRLSQQVIGEDNDTYLLHVRIESEDHIPFNIEMLEIEWDVPIVNMHGIYFGGNPGSEFGHLPFWHTRKDVCVNSGLPYLALHHRSGTNQAAFGLLDQLTETTLQAELSEITRCYHITFCKPGNHSINGQTLAADGGIWVETMFVSFAQAAWHDVLQRYATLVQQSIPNALMPVPECAFDPVFCSWTAVHHDVSHDWIMRNAPIAADLGFRTWLTDDGWFIDKGAFGNYEQVGGWQPSSFKFPDMRAHVKAVQALGLRYVLWVAPFMVGLDNPLHTEKSSILTSGQAQERFDNLSPWHQETGAIVKDLLTRLLMEYGLDGLKIDFIDAISPNADKPAGASYRTMGVCLFEMLSSTIEHLLNTNPDLLIEFRNQYTNLASRHYANLYRSSDVPVNPSLNRWQAVMLRLLAPDRAVHMDPMIWHPDDTDENVAVHLINGIASVPMVSIELDQYPSTHIELIRYWIDFYNKHRATIIHGQFDPLIQQTTVPLIRFRGENESIFGLYDNVTISLDPDKDVQWILNASTRPTVALESSPGFAAHVEIRDKFGHLVHAEDHAELKRTLSVEIGGSAKISKLNLD